MPTRRDYLFSVGSMVSLAGCSAPSASTSRTNESTNGSGGTPASDALTSHPQGPAATVRGFYQALFSEDFDTLNSVLVHPKSPTYPVRSRYLPPESFQGFSKVIIDTIQIESVQSRIVQRLATNVYVGEITQAMGVDDIEYVHTTFYLKKPAEERAYEANTVDIAVEEDTQWYVRYNARKPTHAAQQSETTNSSSRNAT